MVKLFSITIYKYRQSQQPLVLTSAFDLSDFNIFQKGTAREIMQFASREVTSRSKVGDRHSVTYKESLCHVIVRQDCLAACVTSDHDYPQRVVFAFMMKCLEGFTQIHGEAWQSVETNTNLNTPQLEILLKKYQNPEEADELTKIDKNLQETKDILIKSIDQLLERGERLEDLSESADELSFQSKAFMRKAESMNSCCIIL